MSRTCRVCQETARFHNHGYRICIVENQNFDVNLQSQWNLKYRSRASGQGGCLNCMSMAITMQGFTLTAITAEKTKLRHKNLQNQWTVKYRCKALGQCVCGNGVSRAITMQGFTLTSITGAENTKL